MGAELLARLAEKTTNWSSVGGGKDVIGQADVAAMLAWGGAPESVSLYAILKYSNHISMDMILGDNVSGDWALMPIIGQLKYYAYQRAVKVSMAAGWHKSAWQKDIKLVRNMSELALAESMATGVCRKCRGVRYVEQGTAMKLCPSCNGSGVGQMRDCERVDILGLHKTSYSRTWRHRYESVHARIDEWDAEVRTALKRASREYGPD